MKVVKVLKVAYHLLLSRRCRDGFFGGGDGRCCVSALHRLQVIQAAKGRPVVLLNPKMVHMPRETNEYDTVYLLRQFSVQPIKTDPRVRILEVGVPRARAARRRLGRKERCLAPVALGRPTPGDKRGDAVSVLCPRAQQCRRSIAAGACLSLVYASDSIDEILGALRLTAEKQMKSSLTRWTACCWFVHMCGKCSLCLAHALSVLSLSFYHL